MAALLRGDGEVAGDNWNQPPFQTHVSATEFEPLKSTVELLAVSYAMPTPSRGDGGSAEIQFTVCASIVPYVISAPTMIAASAFVIVWTFVLRETMVWLL
jgi:hypothetical protein